MPACSYAAQAQQLGPHPDANTALFSRRIPHDIQLPCSKDDACITSRSPQNMSPLSGCARAPMYLLLSAQYYNATRYSLPSPSPRKTRLPITLTHLRRNTPLSLLDKTEDSACDTHNTFTAPTYCKREGPAHHIASVVIAIAALRSRSILEITPPSPAWRRPSRVRILHNVSHNLRLARSIRTGYAADTRFH